MAFKVYTKTGDKGTTGLIGGTRVGKDNIRIEAYGTIDELNSYVGLCNAAIKDKKINNWLLKIQDRLFTIGSILATDPTKQIKMALPELYESDITWLEDNIDAMETELPTLKSFILPGGDISAAHIHIARCVCRRAERICVHIKNEENTISELVLQYLNRLADFLFVLGRYVLIKNGGTEIEWHPS